MSVKCSYHISGFDCPHCALKTENHLNKQKEIETATIDFSNEKLFITYVDKELTIDELKARIKEVESDPIKITLPNEKKAEHKVFDFEFFFNLSRVVIAFLIALFTKIFVNYETNYLLAIILYSAAALICLYDIIYKVFRNIFKLNNPIDMNLLITISSLGVIVLGSLIHYQVLPMGPFDIDPFDGALVVTLYQVGELFEHVATNKSKRAIKAAINLRAEKAHLLNGEQIEDVAPEQLNVDDRIIVNVGEMIPVDGVIVLGNGSLDTSSLTGESMPVDVKEMDAVLSGTIVKNGSLTIKVTKTFSNSTVSKIMELVEASGERKAKAEKFISKFARIYTPTVFVTGITYALIYGFVTGVWPVAIFCGLAILVVSCPCAIVISVPLAYFAGIGLASKHGIVIKGSNYLDSLCSVGTLFIDKTGTLTYGNFAVSEVNSSNENEKELLDALYLAESRSNHPIAKAILRDVDASKISSKIDEYFEYAGKGIKAQSGKDVILAGNIEFLQNNSVICKDIDKNGTLVHVAKNGAYLGYVVLKDQVREDAKKTVEKLNKYGIKVVLLSGDKKATAEEVSKEVGISEYHHSLLPQDKTKFVEEAVLNKDKKLVAFAGDGINDTPSIIRADVGFAMGGIGSDAAIENADVVLMEDNPKKIADSIKIAKMTRRVAIFDIIFSLSVKLLVIILILTGVLAQFGMITAVLADTGLTVLMIINSFLLIYRKI